MTRLASAALLAVAALIAPGTARAQGACPDGRTASGQCINPQFAEAMRQNAVIFSQPKISYTHYPILPSLDWKYRYPNSLNPDPLKPSPIAPRAPGGGGFVIF
jgi:hypothetical protein